MRSDGPLMAASAVVCILCWFGGVGRTQAQTSFMFQRLSPENGLGVTNVWSVVQDHNGIMWLGVHDGLIKYDGYSFLSINKDQDGRELGWVTDIASDDQGGLWFGTDALYNLDPEREVFTRFEISQDERQISILKIIISASEPSLVWLGTRQNGLYSYDIQSGVVTHFPHNPNEPGSLSHPMVTALVEDNQGTLWVGTNGQLFASQPDVGGLNRLDFSTGRFDTFMREPGNSLALDDSQVTALYQARDGVFWVGTRTGLYKMNGLDAPVFQRINIENHESSHFHVYDILEDDKGRFWVGTNDDGLHLLQNEMGTTRAYRYDAEDAYSLSSNKVFDIHEDRQGVLWIAGEYGISMADGYTGHFNLINTSHKADITGVVVKDKQGTLWVRTLERGLLGYPAFRDEQPPFIIEDERVSDLIEGMGARTLLVDSQDRLWIALPNSGVARISQDRDSVAFYRYDAQNDSSLSNNRVDWIHEDSQGRFWFATRNGLSLYHPETESFSRYHPPIDGVDVFGPRLSVIYEDRRGRLWIGGRGAIFTFHPETGRFVVRVGKLGFYGISNGIGEDNQGYIWVAMSRHGLIRIDPDPESVDVDTHTHIQFGADEGLQNTELQGLIVDDNNQIWLSSYFGLSRVNPADLSITNYGPGKGLPIQKFFPRSIFENEEGDLYFGGWGGLTVFDPDEIVPNPHPPELALVDVRIENESVSSLTRSMIQSASKEQPHVLTAEQYNLSFTFSALHYANPAENKYIYTMQGHEEIKFPESKERIVSFTNLPPRSYTLDVRVANADGIWSAPRSFYFKILPPWWQTKLAYALYAALFIGLIYGGFRVQRRRLLLRERQQGKIREARIKAEAAEERTQMLEEMDQVKSRFFANISHEFRTPLMLLLGPVQDALNGRWGRIDEPVKQQLTGMQRNARRLQRLINQLLDLSKLEAGQLALQVREYDMVSFLKKIVLSFFSLAERHRIELRFDTHHDMLPVYFDADKLEKVFVNLLSNAFKFTRKEGKVLVQLIEDGTFAVVRVSDTGIGISSDQIPFIFDRFVQVDGSSTREQKGSGIGLALAKELVEMHDGVIEVESTEGFGTTFTVRLLLGKDHFDSIELETVYVDEAEEVPLEVDGLLDTVSQELTDFPLDTDLQRSDKRATILLVEDNTDVRMYVKGHLASSYHVWEAGDGQQGLERIHEMHPDLVISDVMMPEMDGYALCQAIKGNPDLYHIPVILLTARASEQDRIEGLGLGADDYLSKPFSADELLLRVENLIEVRRRLRARFSNEVVVGPSQIVVSSEEQQFLERVQAVVEAEMGNNQFGVEQLASEVGTSPRQLYRKMKENLSLTPAGYIRMMRLERAAQLLEQNAGTVSEVSYRVGFKDTNYFSKLFRQTFGQSPSEFKRPGS